MKSVNHLSGPVEEYSFAHISDPHLSSLEGVRLAQLLSKRLLGYLSWRSRRREEHQPRVLDALLRDLEAIGPRQLAITGDLTHIGLPREFVEARQWLERAGPPSSVTLVPGNHDAYVADRQGTTFALWASYMESDRQLPAAIPVSGADLFPSVRIRGPLAFVGLSSARPSAPFLAVGSLGRRQCRTLEAVLAATGDLGLFRILLIHHPPLLETTGWRKRLTDSDGLQRLLRRHGVELILHGHTHRLEENWLETGGRPIPVIGVSSASAIGSHPGRHAQYTDYRLSGGDGLWKLRAELRGYDAGQECFVAEGEREYSIPVCVAG